MEEMHRPKRGAGESCAEFLSPLLVQNPPGTVSAYQPRSSSNFAIQEFLSRNSFPWLTDTSRNLCLLLMESSPFSFSWVPLPAPPPLNQRTRFPPQSIAFLNCNAFWSKNNVCCLLLWPFICRITLVTLKDLKSVWTNAYIILSNI